VCVSCRAVPCRVACARVVRTFRCR
jgi:hypothetical protein